MKKSLFRLLSVSLVIAVFAFSGCATLRGEKAEVPKGTSALGPTVVVATPNVEIDKKASVVIMGTGFQPGKEMMFLITDASGVLTDIGSAMKPVPKADATGTWGTTWNAGLYISKKLIKKGAMTITVADSEYNPIALAPVNFYEKPKKEDEKKKK